MKPFDFLRVKLDQATKAGAFGLEEARSIATVLDRLQQNDQQQQEAIAELKEKAGKAEKPATPAKKTR